MYMYIGDHRGSTALARNVRRHLVLDLARSEPHTIVPILTGVQSHYRSSHVLFMLCAVDLLYAMTCYRSFGLAASFFCVAV
jgi:hypothetical protein